MATQADISEYEAAINDLSTVAYAQLKALLQTLDTQNPIEFRDAILEFYPELLTPFLTAASDVAATWYAALRREANITTSFTPPQLDPPPTEQLDAGVRYSLTPLFSPEQTFIGEAVLIALAGFTQRMIANQGRDTIVDSTTQDRVRVGWQRVPRAGCCAFCAMLASRGAVYSSEMSASGVGEFESRYHNYCRCVVVPFFPDADNDYLEYTRKFFLDQYTPVNRPGSHAIDVKATLAEMRRVHGLK